MASPARARVRADMGGFRRKMDAAHAVMSPGSVTEHIRVTAREVVRFLIDISPRDTNMYVSGWIAAANEAGLGPFTPPRIRPSIRAQELRSRLDKQLADLQFDERFFREKAEQRGVRPERWPFFRRLLKSLARAEESLRKFDERQGAAIVFFGRTRSKKSYALGAVHRVMTASPVLGFGRQEQLDHGARFTLVNKVPHARIVERRKRVAFVAGGAAYKVGLRRLRESLARSLEEVRAGNAVADIYNNAAREHAAAVAAAGSAGAGVVN